MKSILISVSALLLALSSTAQLSTYRFVREGGQISYLNPADSGVLEHTIADDIVLPAKVKIGFAFKFNGEFYDSVGISENGYIWFGPAQASEMKDIINPIRSTLPASVKGVVCAFGVNLHPHVKTALTTTIRTKTQMWVNGPNDFIVEWRNTSRLDALLDPAGEDTMGFQIQLYRFEADRVQISYGYEMGLNPNVTSELSVGMKGASNNDFALRMTDATHTWQTSLAGSSINSTCTFSRTSNPSFAVFNQPSWLNDSITSGIAEERTSSFLLYPVPVTDRLHITTTDDAQPETYEIYNMEGKMLQEGSCRGNAIPVETLASGSYVMKVRSGSSVSSHRFIKN